MEKKDRKTRTKTKRIVKPVRKVKKIVKSKKSKRNIKPIQIVDYTFLISLVLTIIFGFQTNMFFFIPFVIVLVITIVCMGIILVNAVYGKIKKIMNKSKKENE